MFHGPGCFGNQGRGSVATMTSHPHLFVPLAMVSTREHNLQLRAIRAGVTDLLGYQLFRRTARHYPAN